MVRRPATVFLPIRSDSVFPDGVKTFTAEGDAAIVKSEVVSWVNDMAAVSCIGSIKFKYGVDSEQGAIVAVLPLGDAQFIAYAKQFPTFYPEIYGHGCVAEVFNAAEYPYLELEIHSSVRMLAPGECFELTETNQIVEIKAMPTSSEVKAILFSEKH